MIFLAVALSLLATGCGESKLSQCEKLNRVTNRVANQVKTFSQQNNTGKYRSSLAEIAAELETSASELRNLKLQDARLKDLQAQFSQMYADASRASRDLIIAADRRDAKSGYTALQALNQATNREPRLVTQANQYCCPSPDASNRCRP
ncbi:hypothetical protein BST81_07400 [Leptolyngbya sp. 'hensonii']|nr:hypothetical protein BST81_07400 [Leptolyngbya sp. 'hensonii']